MKYPPNEQPAIVSQEKYEPDRQDKDEQDFTVQIPVINSTKTGSTSSGSSNSSGSSLTMSRYRLSYQQKTIEEDNATVKQVIKMLVAVVLFFILCWTPLLTVNLLKALELVNRINDGYLKEIVASKLCLFER